MKRVSAAAAALVAVIVAAPDAGAVQPFVQLETGFVSRDVVEEDSSIAGYTAVGRASSTRLLATVGLDFSGAVTVYAQGGAANLSVEEFNRFDSPFSGAYGGGVRLNLFLSPQPYGFKLFVDGSVLHTTADDTVEAQFGCTAANGCASAGSQGGYLPRLVDEQIEWTEYTVMMGAASRYGPYGPYGGVRLSMVDAKDRLRAPADANFSKEFRADTDLKEQDNFGIFFGTDLSLDRGGRTTLNFEVSLIDQDAIRVAIRRGF